MPAATPKSRQLAILLLLSYAILAVLSCIWIWQTKQSMQARPPMRVVDVARQIEMLNREVAAYVQELSSTNNIEKARPLWIRVVARQHTIEGLLQQFVDLDSNFKVLELQIAQLRQMIEHDPKHLDQGALHELVEIIQEDMEIFASDVHRTMQEIVAEQTRQLHRYSSAVAWLSMAVFSIGFILLAVFLLLSRKNKQLVRLATEDGLTHLLNRRSAFLQGKLLCSMAQRNQQPLALALLDVDHFKQINDVYGHPAGDAALKMLAQILRTYARRDSDVLARIGGEEFMLIMPDTSEEVAEQLCKVLLNALADTKISDDYAFHITASMGLTISEQGMSFEQLYRLADKALYKAKAAGRNQLKLL